MPKGVHSVRRGMLAALFLLVVLCSGCGVSISDTATSAERTEPLTILQAYDIALPIARQWRRYCYPSYASMRAECVPPEEGTRGIRFQFIVDRKVGILSWWDDMWISIDAGSGEVLEIDTWVLQTHGHFKYLSIRAESALLDSPDALAKADDNGGREFKEKHRCYTTAIELQRTGPRYFDPEMICWVVTYRNSSPACPDPEPRNSMLTVIVDARTGEIIRTLRDGKIE